MSLQGGFVYCLLIDEIDAILFEVQLQTSSSTSYSLNQSSHSPLDCLIAKAFPPTELLVHAMFFFWHSSV